MTKKNSFIPLYITNFFGTLNDNFLKTLAGFIVVGWISDEVNSFAGVCDVRVESDKYAFCVRETAYG